MTIEGVQAEMPHFRPARTPNVKVPEIRIPCQQLSRSKRRGAWEKPDDTREMAARDLRCGRVCRRAEGARAQAQFQLPFSLPWSTGTVLAAAGGSAPRIIGVERPARKLRAPADDHRSDPRGGTELSRTASRACGRTRHKRGVTRATFDTYTRGLTPDLRIMDLMDAQPEFTKAFWEYLDLLVSDNRIKRGREILAQYRPDLRCDGEGLRGRSPHRHRDLGHRIELRHLGRRTVGGALDRDALLRRPPPSLFPRRVPGRARDSQPRRHRSRQAQGVLGRRVRADPVHADVVQALSRSISTATAAATSSTRCRTSSPRPPTISSSTAGRPGQTWGYEVAVPQGFDYLLADGAKAMPVKDWEKLGVTRINGKGVPAPGGPRDPVPAGGRDRAGVPDAQQLPGVDEVQPGRGLCARDRPPRRPDARRPGDRHRLAAPGARALERRAL